MTGILPVLTYDMIWYKLSYCSIFWYNWFNGFSIALLGFIKPKVVSFPDTDPNFVNVFIEMPMGTDINETDKTVKVFEQKINEAIKPYNDIIESSISNTIA